MILFFLDKDFFNRLNLRSNALQRVHSLSRIYQSVTTRELSNGFMSIGRKKKIHSNFFGFQYKYEY